MIYRLRCRLGVWCLKWHRTALLEHYEDAKLQAQRQGEKARAERCSYMSIGVKMATLERYTEFQDARRTSHGRFPATRPLLHRIRPPK